MIPPQRLPLLRSPRTRGGSQQGNMANRGSTLTWGTNGHAPEASGGFESEGTEPGVICQDLTQSLSR